MLGDGLEGDWSSGWEIRLKFTPGDLSDENIHTTAERVAKMMRGR